MILSDGEDEGKKRPQRAKVRFLAAPRNAMHIDPGTVNTLDNYLQHNGHFRDNGCRFRPPLTLFLTPLAPRRPRDREPLFLGLCSQMPRILLPSPHPPLFHQKSAVTRKGLWHQKSADTRKRLWHQKGSGTRKVLTPEKGSGTRKALAPEKC